MAKKDVSQDAHQMAQVICSDVKSNAQLRSLIGHMISELRTRSVDSDDEMTKIGEVGYSSVFDTANVQLEPVIMESSNGTFYVAIPSRVIYTGNDESKDHTCVNGVVEVQDSRKWAWDEALPTILLGAGNQSNTVNKVKQAVTIHMAVPGMTIIMYKGQHKRFKGGKDGKPYYKHEWRSALPFRVVEYVDPESGEITVELLADRAYQAGAIPLPTNTGDLED